MPARIKFGKANTTPTKKRAKPAIDVQCWMFAFFTSKFAQNFFVIINLALCGNLFRAIIVNFGVDHRNTRQHPINIGFCGGIGFIGFSFNNYINLRVHLIKLFAKKLHQFAVVNGIIILIV